MRIDFDIVRASAIGAAVSFGTVHTSAQPVLISASQTISPGQATITPTAGGAAVPLATADITVSGGSTVLTINGAHSIASLVVQSSARVSHTAGFTYDADPGPGVHMVGGFALTTTGNVTIAGGSSIDASARGFASGQGPGAGGDTSTTFCNGRGGAAGYGGSGGVGSGADNPFGGGTYGSFAQPTDLGSGGGSNGNGPGANGGGTIRLIVGGTFTNDGEIAANGGTSGVAGGSGSGGSIWMTAPTIVGAGAFRADAFNNACGNSGAGGGRIAVYGNRNGFTGAIQCQGGSGGGPGTIYLDGLPNARPQLIYSGQGTTALSQPLVVADANVDVELRSSAKLSHPRGNASGLLIDIAGNLSIEAGSGIDVSARGFAGSQGPGAGGNTTDTFCTGRGGAAGYGGSGGAGAGAGTPFGGGTYGSYASPTDLGSGGGSNGNEPGANGGGAARIIVGGTLTNNGEIIANGGTSSVAAGSGSGGSVWITTPTLNGAGAVRANGFNNACGGPIGAGGGRIAVYANRTGFSGTIECLGSSGGGPGSVYLEGQPSTRPQLIYSGQGTTALSQPLIVSQANVDLVLRNSVRLSHPPSSISGLLIDVAGNVIIEAGSAIDVSSCGYGSGQGPGAGGSTPDVFCLGRGGAGGYGGNGAAGAGGGTPFGGGTYGSATQPTDLGSGGGSNGNGPGSNGGGAARIIVGGTLTNDGEIISNGGTSSVAAGSGSGGSVWITVPTINGAGAIRANGFNNACGGNHGGGGGRIAVYSCFNNFTGTVESAGGAGAQPGSMLIDTIAGNVAAVASAFCTGDVATLSVQAGGVGTITYQWRRNGVDVSDGVQPSGAIYAGATTAELTITGVTQAEQASYDVEVTASCASIVSNDVSVDVVGASPFPCDNLDFNNDCSAFDPIDIDAFLSVYSEGPCMPAEANCNDIDFNNDGSLFDPLDIDSYLSVFSEGPCL
jgi:hypothetical protein